ncbi:MAG: molybdopterin-guanine dinucleotide biosynthesis protein B [Methanolinea sp.]|nr:molybdopterin-guanine dinucleotide biosynthesis protein B [Methanolinea sp.]
MRVIHVCGPSGSGKTTLIRSLVPLLSGTGQVAVVKHLGHHRFELPAGKDTTLFLDAGATASVGIDSGRAVIVRNDASLRQVLDVLSLSGTRFALVEGYKSLPLPKVITGPFPGAENVVLENPRPGDVLDHLGIFPEYFSPEGLAREVWAEGHVVATGSFPTRASLLPPAGRKEFYDRFFPLIGEMQEVRPGAAAVRTRVHLHQGLYFGGEDVVLFAVGCPSAGMVPAAVSRLSARIDAAVRDALAGAG